jgi:hypothetical protein
MVRTCDNCPFRCTPEVVMNFHLFQAHEDDLAKGKALTCSLCGVGLGSKWKKMDHMVDVHGEAPRFKCFTCGEMFSNPCK